MTCEHARIGAYRIANTGKSAGMWACKDCKRKFVPLDLEQEKDAERYRKVRKMNARQFADVFCRAISDYKTFDDLIDEWAGKHLETPAKS